MKFSNLIRAKEGTKITFHQLLFLITFAIVFGFSIFHLEKCLILLTAVYGLLSPFLFGLFFAFVLNIPMRFFESKLFKKENDKTKQVKRNLNFNRYISIVLALLFLLIILTLIALLIVPELLRSVDSLRTLAASVPSYWNFITEKVNFFFENLGVFGQDGAPMMFNWNMLMDGMVEIIRASDDQIVSLVKRITSSFVNIMIGIVISIYLLAGKEKIKRNLKHVFFAFFSQKNAIGIIQLGALANKTFSRYVTGQFLESFILGALCYIGMTILRIPFPLLISTIVAITGLIPVFGALIGGLIGALIILVVNPVSSLWFLIFLIILQNIESNVIYPKVMGDFVGLPGIFVVSSLFIFGKLFGLMGVFIGIPTFSVIYTLFRQQTAKRIQERKLTTDEMSNLCCEEVADNCFLMEQEQIDS